MSPHLWGESDGWSYSLLSESMSGVGGVSGGIGIPDIVAQFVLAGGWFIPLAGSEARVARRLAL